MQSYTSYAQYKHLKIALLCYSDRRSVHRKSYCTVITALPCTVLSTVYCTALHCTVLYCTGRQAYHEADIGIVDHELLEGRLGYVSSEAQGRGRLGGDYLLQAEYHCRGEGDGAREEHRRRGEGRRERRGREERKRRGRGRSVGERGGRGEEEKRMLTMKATVP